MLLYSVQSCHSQNYRSSDLLSKYPDKFLRDRKVLVGLERNAQPSHGSISAVATLFSFFFLATDILT